MANITPQYLIPGDTIGIVATARYVERESILSAIRYLTNKGFVVKTAPHLFSRHYQFAGIDEERAQDFMEMVEDSSVKAILCARGGYGTVRILEYINLRKLQINPKWVVGFSDITVLHSIINSWYGLESIHATMPIDYPTDLAGNESTERLIKLLTGDIPQYAIPRHPLNRMGKARGLLTGGNLSLLASQIGTDADFSAQERILFLEDVDEYLYHIDRMMMQLKRSGRLKSIVGLVVGAFTDMRDNEEPFGSDAYEIIYSITKDLRIPIAFGFSAGHVEPNLPLIMGRQVELRVEEQEATLTFEVNPEL